MSKYHPDNPLFKEPEDRYPFRGVFGEVNTQSPGGPHWQERTQRIALACLGVMEDLIDRRTYNNLVDGMSHPILYGSNVYAEMMIKAHESGGFSSEAPVIGLLVGSHKEEGSSPQIAEALNGFNIASKVITPTELIIGRNRVGYEDNGKFKPVTAVHMNVNNARVLEYDQSELEALYKAMADGLVVNHRALAPLGLKQLYEVATNTNLPQTLDSEIRQRFPWTRTLREHEDTLGPRGEIITNLPDYVALNLDNLILKRGSGNGAYSGQGFYLGRELSALPASERAEILRAAQELDIYITQPFIPAELWAETIPVYNQDGHRVEIKRVQTDFRLYVQGTSESGSGKLVGFLGRSGGIPTNIGSGGALMPIAVVPDEIDSHEMVGEINAAFTGLETSTINNLAAQLKTVSEQQKAIYNGRLVPVALRPRIVTMSQFKALQELAIPLWNSVLNTARSYQKGEFRGMVNIDPREEAIITMRPVDDPYLLGVVAADMLVGF